MTLKIATASRLRDRVAGCHTVDGRPASTDEGRVGPEIEGAALPAVGEQAVRGRKAEAPAETDAEPESTVCAAYWAY